MTWNLCHFFPPVLSLPELRRRCPAVPPPGKCWTGITWVPGGLSKKQIYKDSDSRVSPPTPTDLSFYNPTFALCLPRFSEPRTGSRILQDVVPLATGPYLIGKWKGDDDLVKCRFLSLRDLLNQEGLRNSGFDEHPSAYWYNLSSEGTVALVEGSHTHTSHHLVPRAESRTQ